MAGTAFQHDDLERARQCAGKAMMRMEAEKLPPTPDNFAIWYGYYSGRMHDLQRVVDILRSNKEPFTGDRMAEIHRRFFGFERQEDAVVEAGGRMQTVLGQLVDLLRMSGADTNRYGEQLSGFSGDLKGVVSGDQLRKLVAAIAAETQEMVRRNEELQAQLSTYTTEVEDLRRNLDDVRREALTDALTGLHNRLHFDRTLREAASQAMESGAPLSLIMVDVDHFKRFNDTYGHTIGDHVLALVARALRESIKGRDTAARYGGEEFVVILPGTPLGPARIVAEQIRTTVASRQIINKSKKQSLGTITLSAGVALYEPGESLATLVQRADEALYDAKRTGRNRVVIKALPGQEVPA